MTVLDRDRTRALPVVEVFGPTIQGEGFLAGAPSYFIRFGGCDWRCNWCDSMHAVDPAQVRQAPRLTLDEVAARLDDPPSAEWVTLSGGNPALHELGPLVTQLQRRRLRVAVETQGSKWRDWLGDVDHLTISPKPPSSGEAGTKRLAETAAFMDYAYPAHYNAQRTASLKVVVFDREDLDFALATAARYHWLPFYISTGTDSQGGEPIANVADRYRTICEALIADGSATAKRARVLPQLHVIAWGHRLGV